MSSAFKELLKRYKETTSAKFGYTWYEEDKIAIHHGDLLLTVHTGDFRASIAATVYVQVEIEAYDLKLTPIGTRSAMAARGSTRIKKYPFLGKALLDLSGEHYGVMRVGKDLKLFCLSKFDRPVVAAITLETVTAPRVEVLVRLSWMSRFEPMESAYTSLIERIRSGKDVS